MLRRPLVTVGVVLTVLGVALLTWVMQRDAEPAQASAPSSGLTTTTDRSARPVTLRIGSIDLDHEVVPMGVSAEGKIDPPPGTVMWFTGLDRVQPGSVGTSVIAGHVAIGGKADSFADLRKVNVGDTVDVVAQDGKTVAFRVVRASAIDKAKVVQDQAVWGPNTSKPRLAIVTCDDAFGFRDDGHRVANFVVIADAA
jgi:LPXTG-site transpeptidase (sortase) family protein